MSLRKIKSFDIVDFDCSIFPSCLTNINSSFVFSASGFIEGITTPGGYMRYNGGGVTNRASWMGSFVKIGIVILT